MTRIGCTGHQNLDPRTRRRVAEATAALLAAEAGDDLVGFTSLAEGADQLFAFAVLAAGGQIHAVIPSKKYEQSFESDQARDAFVTLLALASSCTTLPYPTPTEEAYLAAGQEVADRSEILVAIWDGQDPAGKGGTGDIVSYAREHGIDVRIIWPPGAQRH